MKKSEVSSDFMSFYGRNATRIEESKKAESRSNNIPLPIGTSGHAVISDFKFGKSKDKSNPDGTTKEGTPYITISLHVVDNADHQGKTLNKTYWLNNSANLDAAGRYQYFLDDMEKLGLPRELRVNHDTPAEIGDYFLTQEAFTVHFSIIEDKYNSLDDGKGIRLTNAASGIKADDSVVPVTRATAPAAPAPTPTAAPAPAPAAPSASGIPAVGTTVKYLDMDWTVVEVFAGSGKVQIKNIEDPRMEKVILASNLDG